VKLKQINVIEISLKQTINGKEKVNKISLMHRQTLNRPLPMPLHPPGHLCLFWLPSRVCKVKCIE